MKIEFEKKDLLDLVKVLEHYRTFDHVIESVCLKDLIFRFEDALLEWVDDSCEEKIDDSCSCTCCNCCDDDDGEEDDEDEEEEDFDFDETIAESTLVGLPPCNGVDCFDEKLKLTFENQNGELFLIAKDRTADIEDIYGPVRTVRRSGKGLQIVGVAAGEESFEVKKFPQAWLEKLTASVTYKVGT